MNRDRDICAHERTLTLEDQSVGLGGDRYLGASAEQELVPFAKSRCFAGFVGESDFACRLLCQRECDFLKLLTPLGRQTDLPKLFRPRRSRIWAAIQPGLSRLADMRRSGGS
jgi:hypothetical protein